MCGIIGYIGPETCTQILVQGLERLEYRGYDSAGVAVVSDGALGIRRAEGKLRNLVQTLGEDPVEGTLGIGHTRWATHGRPSETNAHPHAVGSVAVVHNGIIENHLELKRELEASGHTFESETDTEVVAHLVWRERQEGHDLPTSVRRAVGLLRGAYALVVIDADDPSQMVAARYASPLVLGLGDDAGYVASDIPAILSHTRRVVFLRDGVMAVVTSEGSTLSRVEDGEEVPLEETQITWSPAMAEKGGYKHFMLKEIHEQPEAIANTLRGRISQERGLVDLPELSPEALRPEAPERVREPSRIYMVACGTSWHAGLVGRYLMENLAGLAPHVELASEFRYRKAPVDEHTLVIAISQSGETADTLAAIKDARARGATIISICNVLESSIPRASHGTLYTHAGPEISVASTKAFTTQLAALHLLALHFGQQRGRISDEVMAEELDALVRVPSTMERVLQDESAYLAFARRWHEATSMLFLGRGNLYPLALEGALKLKEISYIHAEGYPAGELKHGPIALIDEGVPSIFLNPRDVHYDKVRSNLQEVKARGGPLLVLHSEGHPGAVDEEDITISMPEAHPHVLPMVAAIPLQLLAYHMADFKGTDVDQPRNLAKSVTVE